MVLWGFPFKEVAFTLSGGLFNHPIYYASLDGWKNEFVGATGVSARIRGGKARRAVPAERLPPRSRLPGFRRRRRVARMAVSR